MRPRAIPFPAAAPALAALLMVLLAAGGAAAQDLASFEKRTTVHRLENGWTFIIVERPVAPVFSFATYANVGGAQEVPGITGLAHMFEHMAFKGTPHIGTTDYQSEKVALEKMEEAYQAYQAARLDPGSDPEEVERRLAEFKQRQEEAAAYVVKNEFGDIVDREGGVGLNAFTNSDFTGYFYSLPANKIELFAFLESERFLHPVFREFYTERDVVQEERRWRTESQPVGRLVEQFQAAAFVAHPYKQPVVGYMSDLQSITMSDAEEFFRVHYAPSNLTTAIVGDVDPETLVPLLEKYFGRIAARPGPEPLRTVEPPQIAEKTVVLEDPSQPIYVEGYHKPGETHPDQPVWDAIDDIFSSGRTSRLYRTLVRDRKIAVQAGSFSSFPGQKYPTLWLAFAVPAKDVTNEAIQEAIRGEIERLRTEDVSAAELDRFKTRAKAGLLRSLRSNQGLANNLVRSQILYGDWRELFRYIDRIDRVTAADIRRVAGSTLVASNRTVGMLVTATAEDAAPAKAGEEPGEASGEAR